MLAKRKFVLVSLASLFVISFLVGMPLAWHRAVLSRGHANHSLQQTSDFQGQASNSTGRIPGLLQPVTVIRDSNGVPHVNASDDHDAYFMMGYMHAQDRFFQMDIGRRRGSGTAAELLGAGPNDLILIGDVVSREFGIGRAAERSLSAYSPEALGLIQAYSDGVNAWLDNNPLPPEYQLLEITQVPRWKPVDSLTIVKAIQFQLSFDTTDLANTATLANYVATGAANGFDGAKLYFEDIFSFRPFAPVVTIPRPAAAASTTPRGAESPSLQSRVVEQAGQTQGQITPGVIDAARKLLEQCSNNSLLKGRSASGIGSNWWVVAGSKTNTGKTMMANDPHLDLGTPATLYEIQLKVDQHSSPMNVYGVSFAGVPGVFLGQNERLSWGVTNSSLDVTDFYAEKLVVENGAPVATIYKDRVEPLVVVPEVFKLNQIQDGVADDIVTVSPGDRPSGLTVPPATLVVPRRNNGPLFPGVLPDGFSIQYTGASATHDLEGIFALARATNMDDFKRDIQLLEAGSLNWLYTDINGNIATFVNGKVPLREDLQAGTVEGLPPFFLRDGTGALRNEWIPRSENGPGVNYESIPFEEMPQVVNPAQKYLVNANNDPVGVMLDNNPLNQTRGNSNSIYYISSGFDPGYRAIKINNLLNQQFGCNHGNGKVSFEDMQRIQSNVQMLDAEYFTPYIIRAFDAGRRAGAPDVLESLTRDRGVREAVGRLSNWDFSTPTGILAGYDASDTNGIRRWPSGREVSNSIATTIYTVWRSRLINNTISATLVRSGLEGIEKGGERPLVDIRFLLDHFSTNHGMGASGLDFFEIPGVDAPPEVRRDALMLMSLKEALDLLAGDQFVDAFGRSTSQNDYRWGKLHRITFSHIFSVLAPQFSVPTADGFEDLSPTLPGLSTDGGFETIDNGPIDTIGASSQAYTFFAGPVRRYVCELRPNGIKSVQIIPGGESGVIGNRFHTNQLSSWLTNDYHRVLFADDEINNNRFSMVKYLPGN